MPSAGYLSNVARSYVVALPLPTAALVARDNLLPVWLSEAGLVLYGLSSDTDTSRCASVATAFDRDAESEHPLYVPRLSNE